MLGVLLTGLILCPVPTAPDGGVVTVQRGTQWIFSDGVDCEQPTIISPDSSPRIQSVMQPPPPEKLPPKVIEPVKEKPFPAKSPAITPNCQPIYRAYPVTLKFVPDKDDLTSIAKARLIDLLSQSPQGVTIVGYVADGATDTQLLERMTRRVNSVEVVAKTLAGPRSVIEKQHRSAERGTRVSGTIEVIGIFASFCGQETSGRSSVPQGLSLSSTMPNQGGQGGRLVAQ